MRVLKVLAAVVLLWSLVWGAAAWGLRSAVTGWFEARAAEGWQADYAAAETRGYPLRHATVLRQPALADPGTGTAWRADWIGFESPAIWPGRQSLRFAETPQFLSYFDDTRTLVAEAMTADLDLAPGLALRLDRLSLTSGGWQVAQDAIAAVGGGGLTLAMQRLDAPEVYEVRLAVPSFTPGARLRRLMDGAESLPASFERLELDAEVRFDRPWDRRALEERRPQPRRVDLRLAEAAWGPLRLSATGGLDVDENGLPEGRIAIRAENWREMLRMAEAAGALPEPAARAAERALGFLAGLGGRPEALDVQLNLTGGVVALGPLPIGPAPRLILR